jgi:hypothetical protein
VARAADGGLLAARGGERAGVLRGARAGEERTASCRGEGRRTGGGRRATAARGGVRSGRGEGGGRRAATSDGEFGQNRIESSVSAD